MFNQYFQLGHRIRNHYFSLRVILCLVTGRLIPPIHRKNLYSLQYIMLPTQRASVLEVWNRLTEQPGTATKNGAQIPNGKLGNSSMSSMKHG